jgi:protein-L-isoaspartate(D-aspartate) O-methyltransferase
MKSICILVLVFLLAGCSQVSTETAAPSIAAATSAPDEDFEFYRPAWDQLIAEIKNQGVQNIDVLHAMEAVPRHKFVLDAYLPQAYENHPLPIGYGQTISQPYIVAWMTELLELQPGEKVLEIGTGSGYQAAVLAEMDGVEVYSIEIVPELAESAAKRLEDLGYTNVHVKQGDGYYGWPEQAPFDAIIVTAAPDHLPAPLVEQLSKDGRIVIPIGPQGWIQSLWKFVQEAGELKGYNLGGVSFVPFTGPGTEQHLGEPTSTP